jgi:hypothetical protein
MLQKKYNQGGKINEKKIEKNKKDEVILKNEEVYQIF